MPVLLVTALAMTLCSCDRPIMVGGSNIRRGGANPIFRAQVENLYVEAMVLADEAYGCFSVGRDLGNAAGEAVERIALACESLKTTTRMMHIIAWLLHQRAMLAGERGASSKDSAATLGDVLEADHALCARFDPAIQRVVRDSERLFDRVRRLDVQWRDARTHMPVQAMLCELEARL